MEVTIRTSKIKVTSFGKGGTTSSGNWHVHYEKVGTGYSGNPYVQELTESFFTKRAMEQWLATNA